MLMITALQFCYAGKTDQDSIMLHRSIGIYCHGNAVMEDKQRGNVVSNWVDDLLKG